MTWLCVYTPQKIRILKNSIYIGDYDLLEYPYCEKCGSPGVLTENCLLKNWVYGFNRVYAMGKYYSRYMDPYPLLSSHIKKLKDFHREEFAIPLGYALYGLLKHKYPNLLEANYIIPVPAHEDKVRKRGFNQVELISQNLSEISTLRQLLCLKQVKNIEMRGQGLEERYEEVKGAFELIPMYRNEIKGSYVLLLDDVVTTGATASECSKVLLENGVRKIDVLTCGRNVLE